MFENATPRPWQIEVDDQSGIGRTHSLYVCNGHGWPEGQLARINTQDGLGEREANAALIVHAVNNIEAHEAELATLRAQMALLEKAFVEEREDNLWEAYNTGFVKDGRWTHAFMSTGEWLARECGLDPRLPDYDDAEIRAAIPVAARNALAQVAG